MTRSLLLLAPLAAALCLAGCKPAAQDGDPDPGARPAATASEPAPFLGKAPSWRLKDVNGNTVSSDQFKGKVMVVDFWATWCEPCRSEIPGYVDLQKKYADDGLVIIGMATGNDTPAKVKAFIKKYDVTYQIVMSDSEVENAFGGMDAIPTTFIIDRDGNIRDRKVGALETAVFERRLLPYLRPTAD